MKNSKKIIIITVNYKTTDLVKDLLETVSAERNQFPNLEHIVVDNFSNDGSIEALNQIKTDNSYDWLHIIDAKKNGGYAYGNNLAIDFARNSFDKVDYFWLLNPDTRLRPDATKFLVEYIENNNVHCVGSRLEDEDGTAQLSCFNYPTLTSELLNGAKLGVLDKIFSSKLVTRNYINTPIKTDWLAGASVMFTAKYIETVGLMDDDYFLYFEEVDYCLTGTRKGFPCYYVPQSRVYHAVGAATGISEHRKKAPRRPKYWFESRRRFFIKNYGKLYSVLTDLGFVLMYSIWVVRKSIFDKKSLQNVPPHFLKDFIKNSALFNGIKKT